MTSVLSVYRFVRVADPHRLRYELHRAASDLQLKGTLLIAGEGINGTLAGARARLAEFEGVLRERPEFAVVESKYSTASRGNPVFHRLKVRVKREIVTLGEEDLDPAARTGAHMSAARWNELLDDPEVHLIDTRNRYETAIGTFPGAVDPDIGSFRQFPSYVRDTLDPERHPRVAMFCTGGIRCEKASAYLLKLGFAEVYQLQGGILKYLETVAPEDNRWLGECFVFDQRVSVDASLGEGTYEQCFACRRPLSGADRRSPDYRVGVSCPYCVQALTSRRQTSLRERQRQVALAAARGVKHIGEPQRTR